MSGTQTYLDWEKRDRDLEALRKHLREVGIEDSDVRLLVTIAGEDDSRGAESYAAKSKKEWAETIGVRSRNTPVSAMRRLASRGVLAWEARGRHEVLVDWRAVWNLRPPDTAQARLKTRLTAEREALVRGEVRGGQGCARVPIQESKARANRDRVSVPSAPRGLESRLVRPWSTTRGLTDEDLQWAVETGSKVVLRRLYMVGVEEGWWCDSEDHRQRFLQLSHHAATTGDHPMGLLQSLCRRDSSGSVLRSGRVKDASRDWPSQVRRFWRKQADPVLQSAARACEDEEGYR